MRLSVLFCAFLLSAGSSFAQEIPYGNNPAAGKYLDREDARIYYEVYGEGRPLLLLHGDLFGYIDEYAQYLPILSEQFRVIAVATRGHGKSDIGRQPFSYGLFAEDALAALRAESADSAVVVGFSGGAITGYTLAAQHPEAVRKLVAMAGALGTHGYRPEAVESLKGMTAAGLEADAADFVNSRKALMPEPGRYADVVEGLKAKWLSGTYVSPEQARAIRCPVLTIVGDRDEYFPVENSVEIYRTIPGSQLAITPNSGHVSLILNPEMFRAVVMPFLMDPSIQGR